MIFIKGTTLNRCDIEPVMKENPLKGLKKKYHYLCKALFYQDLEEEKNKWT